MTNRTDSHRPAAIVPADYEYVLSYNGATSSGGWPIPSFGINCELDRRWEEKDSEGKTVIHNGKHNENGQCCVIGLLHVAKVAFAGIGATCKCSVCGAAFIYGDVWKHVPTGEHIHLGHTCAAKYSLLADRSAYELQLGRLQAAAAKEIIKAKNLEERQAFLDGNPGLEVALQTDHPIVKDISARFQEYRKLSDKQVTLVLKLAAEANKPAEEKEKLVAAPAVAGRLTFEGTIVSAKVTDGYYGTAYKFTVKVVTPEGNWLAWGTCPRTLVDSCTNTDPGVKTPGLKSLVGRSVKVTAGLKPGRDAHFALLQRPIAEVLS